MINVEMAFQIALPWVDRVTAATQSSISVIVNIAV